jgi:hypothetical protein
VPFGIPSKMILHQKMLHGRILKSKGSNRQLQQEVDNITINSTRLGWQKEEMMKQLLFASLQTMSTEKKDRVQAM